MKTKTISMCWFSSGGYSTVEIVIATGIGSLVSLAAFYLLFSVFKQSSKSEIDAMLAESRLELIQTLKSDTAFQATMTQNPGSFACILNNQNCLGQGGEFLVFDENIRALNTSSLSTNANQGFSSKGIACNTFVSPGGAGSDTCPFKYVARWEAVCGSRYDLSTQTVVAGDAICLNPTIKISVDFLFSPATRDRYPILSAAKMNIILVRSQKESDPSTLCGMVGGAFVAENNTDVASRVGSCAAPSSVVSGNCISQCAAAGARPNSGYVVGFEPNGLPICECDIVANPVDCNLGQPNNVGNVIGSITLNGGSVACPGGIISILRASGDINKPPVGAEWLPQGFPGGDGGGK